MTIMTLSVISFIVLAAIAGGSLFLILRCRKDRKKGEEKISILERDLERARTLDEISGAYNYPIFVKMANIQIKMARRHKWPASLLIIDIDQLENINLRYSFKTGNSVLKHLTEVIVETVRSSDVLGRFGGSGVFILLGECSEENVEMIVDRIKKKIVQNPLKIGEKQIEYRCTTGAVVMYGVHASLNRMMDLAENALGLAKEEKKEMVILDQEGMKI